MLENRQNLFGNVAEQVGTFEGSAKENVQVNGGAHDAEGHPVQEIESLCMNCHADGTTRLLLTRIPYFREIIIMSFQCPECGFKNSEIQPAAQVAEKGARYVFKVENKEDFNRQVVKSESATCKFEELDIEIPARRGQLTNVEGLLLDIVRDLEMDQPLRQEYQPEIFDKINSLVEKINSYINAEANTLPLTLTVDDPAGNSWIEYVPGTPPHKWSCSEYTRTRDQAVFLGLLSADEASQHRRAAGEESEPSGERNTTGREIRTRGFASEATDIENFDNEVQTFNATCSACYKPSVTHMKKVDIPHFKEVIIMCTICDYCGYKSNEVKTGGEIPPHGRKITLKLDDPEDLGRDILKSETCGLTMPELNLDLTPGTLGGRFTTVEGLLTEVYTELHNKVFTETSDSMDDTTKTRWAAFFSNLQNAIDGKIQFTIQMEDPLAASYIQNVYAPDDDPNMTIQDYERSFEQNDELGLNDMKTD